MVVVLTRDVMEKFKLELLGGEEGIGRTITTSDISRPGLEMAGYFTHYPANRVQLLGKTELSFFEMLPANVKLERMRLL
ncbi:HPr kinase/phosphorylase, partial [Bacillus cereus]